jgi:hypothetical protein
LSNPPSASARGPGSARAQGSGPAPRRWSAYPGRLRYPATETQKHRERKDKLGF